MAASVFIKAAFFTVLTLVSVFSITTVVKSLNSTTGPEALADNTVANDSLAAISNQPAFDAFNYESLDNRDSQELVFQDDDYFSEDWSDEQLVSSLYFSDDDEHDEHDEYEEEDDDDRWESHEYRRSSHRSDD